MEMSKMVPKVVVIGIDGCTFNLLNPLMNSGRLSTFERIIREGCKGYMESCIPVSSIPAWQCYSTGREPSKLGFYGFFKAFIEENKVKVRPVNSYDVEGKEIWDYLGEFRYKSCVIDMPGTYPARKIRGVMLSNPMIGDNWVYPTSLKESIKQLGYRDPVPHEKGTKRYFEDLMEVIWSRFEAARYLLRKEKPDFLHLTIFYIEVVHHNAWGNRNLLLNFYEMIDSGIGKILEIAESMNEDVTIIVMSDHGHTELKDIFYINEFLRIKGYLKVKSLLLPRIMHKIGLNAKLLQHIAGKLGVLSAARRVIPNRMRELIPDERGHLPGPREITERINVRESHAFSIDGMQVYLLRKDDDLREILIKELKDVKHPIAGDRVMEVYRKEEAYSEYDENTPDILINPNEGYWISRDVRMDKRLWSYLDTPSDRKWLGTHSRNGIFIAYGRHIKRSSLDVRIYDFAPTVLHMFNIPIPNDMDGRVLKDIFKDDSEYAKRPLAHARSEKPKIKKKIAKLKADGKV